MAQRFYLGVDGGGTQTRAVLAGENGRICSYAHAGSANRNHYSREQARTVFETLLRETLSGLPPDGVLSALFLGLGGISTDLDRQEGLDLVREIPEIGPNMRVQIENDTWAGLIGGLSGRPGIALIAGTGSACLGINGRGEQHLCGGWGAVADDIGSAPWVGLHALQAAVRAQDGREAPTALQEIVFSFLGLSEPRDLIRRIHNEGLDRTDLGRLALHVTEAAKSGDLAALSILQDAVAGLSEMVSVTAHRLFEGAACEMILVGGLALSGPPFQPLLLERLCFDCPNVTVRVPELSPALGAVLCAMQSDGVVWTPEIFANLASSHD